MCSIGELKNDNRRLMMGNIICGRGKLRHGWSFQFRRRIALELEIPFCWISAVGEEGLVCCWKFGWRRREAP